MKTEKMNIYRSESSEVLQHQLAVFTAPAAS
jgi:hypothetical protein